MKAFKFVISTPDGNVYKGDVSGISLMGSEGSLSILAGHIPFVTATKPCDVKITEENGEVKTIKVSEGLLTVSKEKTVLLCSPN